MSSEFPQTILSPLETLKSELDQERNWGVALPSWVTKSIVFREGIDAEAYVDPRGGPQFSQTAVPCKLGIEKLGRAAIPAGEDWFDIRAGNNMGYKDVMEFFAPGEYQYIKERLGGFEKFKSGILALSDHIKVPEKREDKVMEYDTKYPGKAEFEPMRLSPKVLIDAQRLAGKKLHNILNIKPSSLARNRIVVEEEKFTLAASQAWGDRFERAAYEKEGETLKVGDLTYAQARQMKEKMGLSEAEILNTSKVEKVADL